jgi:outer membrane protein assembly factor BamB
MRFSYILLLVCLPLAVVSSAACREDPTRAAGTSSNPAGAVELKDGRFSRNMVNTIDKNLPADWSVQEGATKNVKWAVKIGRERTGYLPPAISGGKLFIATNNTAPSDPKVKGNKAIMKCLREADGQFLWQIVHDPPPPQLGTGPGGRADEDGLLSTPFVEENRLYYVAPAGEVVCADTDGKIIWRYDMMKELKVVPCYCSMCCPLVVGDRVFVVTGNGVDPNTGKVVSPGAPSFAAFEKKTGKLSWSCNLPGANILDGQWTSPAFTMAGGKAQVIFPGGDGLLYSLNPDTGDLIWKFDCNPKSAKVKKTGRDAPNYLLAAPVVYEDKVYIGVGHNPEGGPGAHVGHFWCIDATKTGDVSPVEGNLDPRAEANKKSALVWHYGGLVLPEPKRARREVFGFTLSTSSIHDGLVYISEFDGILHCLDAKTGQKQWEFDLLTSVWSSPYYVAGTVYLGADNGELAVFPAGKAPPRKEDVKKFEVGSSVKAPVVVVNGTLYVTTGTHLYAIAGK